MPAQLYGGRSRPDAEARTPCRTYNIMRSDLASWSAGAVARTVAPYQSIGAHLPETPWLDGTFGGTGENDQGHMQHGFPTCGTCGRRADGRRGITRREKCCR